MTISHERLCKRLGVTPQELRHFCERSLIPELALFGSVLSESFRSDSDIDVLVTLVPDDGMSLMDFVGLEYQFERKLVETDPNWIRRREILDHLQVIYESRRVLSS